MENDFLEYYGEHSISPVHQDITDIELHYNRRKKLYRQCGIPIMTFRNAELLEIGAGGGYNTLAFFHWNVKHVDVVEANPQGIADMQELFIKSGVSDQHYTISHNKIENYKTNKKYDIVIAEGFLPYVFNQKEIIAQLKELIVPNGIVVITCTDNVGMFIEAIKRLVGIALSATIDGYDKKVAFLTEFFEPQLKKLRGVSRSPKEWVQDQILNPAGVNGMELSLIQAIKYFGEDFDVLGCSPKMFTDYSWYKDVWYDYKKNYEEQFRIKRFSLLQANMKEIILPLEITDKLVESFYKIKDLAALYEKTLCIEAMDKIIKEMDSIQEIILQYFDNRFQNVFLEIREILYNLYHNKEVFMDNYLHFFEAFGRTQQYISFVKK